MQTDSVFWRDLEAQFRALPTSAGLVAMLSDGQWLVYDGPEDKQERARLHDLFRSLAQRAGIAAGIPSRANALDGWLDLLREQTSHFHPTPGTWIENGVRRENSGGSIHNLALASAEYCVELATRALELKTAGQDADPPGLRRDRYPFSYWLYDHSHETLSDPKEELAYWNKHVWHGFHVLMEKYEQVLRAGTSRNEKLISAVSGLSYDFAVLQANYVLDRGLRGEEAIKAFREESAELLEEVESAWRASSERLGLSFGDEAEELKGLAQPFHRVRDDLRRLLTAMPNTRVRNEQTIQTAAGSLSQVSKAKARTPRKRKKPVAAKPARMRGTVTSPSAARKLEMYLEQQGIGLTDFASRASTTDRTLRSFRRTGRIRRSILQDIAEQMGTTKEELLKPLQKNLKN